MSEEETLPQPIREESAAPPPLPSSSKKSPRNAHPELYMKRKARLAEYKAGQLSEKTKKWLGFPSKIYQNWQAHWTTDNEDLGVE